MTAQEDYEAHPNMIVTVKGNVTIWTFVKPQTETRRTEEVEPDPVYRRRRIHTGKPPFDTLEARRNHDLRREYVSYWAQRARGVDMPFPGHLRDVTCGAKTRAGTLCKQRALYANARCKFHGGLSTGPVSVEGKRRSAENGKCRGRATGSDPNSEPQGMLVNVGSSTAIDTQRRPSWLTDRDSEPHVDPLITPRSQEPSEHLRERATAENQTKPDIAPAQTPIDKHEKTSVRGQPTNKNEDWLAPWMSV